MARKTPARRLGRRVLRMFGIVLLATVVTGSIYEQIGAQGDRQRLLQIGRSVDIGGRSLNIYCSGEGSPAVILDSGSGDPGYTWTNIQPELSTLTRACWFDRAGYGWSDVGPFPGTSSASSEDLRKLLLRAGVPAPYVLVGHSLGGLNARVFTAMYPDDVAGLVLVDAAHEDEPKRAPRFMLGRTAPRLLWHPVWLMAQTARVVGLIRFMTSSATLPRDPAQRTREQVVDALRRQPKAIATLADPSTPESYAQAAASGSLGDRPLIVLTRGKVDTPAVPSSTDLEYAAYMQIWMHEIQPKLARLSTRGQQIIVENIGHHIPDEAPKVVTSAVRQVLADVRAARKSPFAQPRYP